VPVPINLIVEADVPHAQTSELAESITVIRYFFIS